MNKPKKSQVLNRFSLYYLRRGCQILNENGIHLRKYQKDGVRWMIKREMVKGLKGGFLCDEMGLGKTIQVISLILSHPAKKTLVILPSSVLYQWKQEFNKFAPHLNVLVHHGTKRVTSLDDKRFIEADVLLTTYGLTFTTTSNKTFLHSYVWGRIVLDECHLIRNPRSGRFKGCCALKSNIKWGLTGTPIQNYLNDFLTLFKFFGIKGNVGKSEENINIIRRKYILRRTKHLLQETTDELKLPDLNIENIEIPFMSEDEEKFYTKIKENELRSYREFGEFENNAHAFTVLLRLKQASIHPQLVIDGYQRKYNRNFEAWKGLSTKTLYIINQIKKEKEKTIIFCTYTKEIDIFDTELSKLGFKTERITGATSPTNKHIILERSKEIDVLLVNINAGGVGLNMTDFNRVFITSPSWNPCNDAQAIARSHRIGQKKVVKVSYIIVVSDKISTIDENILQIQQKKKALISKTLDDEYCFHKIKNISLNNKDFRCLFK